MTGCHRANVVYWNRTPPVFSRLADAILTLPSGSARTAAVGEASPVMSRRVDETICLEERPHINPRTGSCQAVTDLRGCDESAGQEGARRMNKG